VSFITMIDITVTSSIIIRKGSIAAESIP